MNKRRSNRRQATSNTTKRAIETANNYSVVAGRAIPDHELTTFGPSNVIRRFDLDEPSNGPSVIFRQLRTFASFSYGYTSSSINDQDCDAAVDITIADPKQALIPVTPMAEYFEKDVYPVLLNLFTSGTGTRYSSVSINEVIRLQAMALEAYSNLLIPVIINKLVYHTDWAKIAPFSETVPSFMYQIATNLQATDIGLADIYLPLMRRLDNIIIFPRLVSEVKRMMSPMMALDLHGRVNVPFRDTPYDVSASEVITRVNGYLDYIDSHLTDVANLMATFLPFPFSGQDGWSLPDLPLIDVDRDSGWFNSSAKKFDVFGDTGDPTIKDVMLCDEAANETALLYTRHCQPIWSEIKLSTIFWLEDDATDDTFILVTPHAYDRIFILDDAFDYVAYDGTAVEDSDLSFRYIDYANCRFASRDVDYGVQKPGTFGAELGYTALLRMMRLETSYLFSVEILKVVSANLAGASLREIRYTISDLIQDGMISGM